MAGVIGRSWRFCATALGYAVFGVFGSSYYFILPLLTLLIRNKHRRVHVCRSLTRVSFLVFIWLMRLLGVWSWKTEGLDKLNKPGQLIVCNHLTLVDIVFLFAFTPNATAVVKADLLRNPFLRMPVLAGGYIANNTGPGLVQKCSEELSLGSSVVIFPEGTRTPPGEKPHIHRGAAAVAMESGVPLSVVRISCEPLCLTKNWQWWRIPKKPMFFTFEFAGTLDPLLYRKIYEESRSKALRAVNRVH